MSVLLARPIPPEPKAKPFASTMRAFAQRATRSRSTSLSTVPPPRTSSDYSHEHAAIAATILYRSPLPSESGLPIYVLNAAAFPDAFEVDYDTLLPYVLARLPGEEELLAGEEYEIIFFAGGQPELATAEKKERPNLGWYLQAYHVLSRAIRKRLRKLYVVHERSWVRVLIEIFGTIVSPKFRKKIVHVNTLSGLALYIPIEQLLIPPSVYLHDRRVVAEIDAPWASGRRAFGANDPLPRNLQGERRLPRVLRETTMFILHEKIIKTEGLFRIPAHSQLLGVLREGYDRGQKFIVWREGNVSYAPGMDHTILREIGVQDTYGASVAAGLIKLWYRELMTPIFEETRYEETRQNYGTVGAEFGLEELTSIVSPASTTSILTETGRYIMTMHLLPLLSRVAANESWNKMSAENLAICFAPAMVCGPDQLADAKMTTVIRRILTAAVKAWPNGLREACQTSDAAFERAVNPPKDARDYEDPLYEGVKPHASETAEDVHHRIDLRDEELASPGPPLPPRPSSSKSSASFPPPRGDSLVSPVKRKPAPHINTMSRHVVTANNNASNSPVPTSPASSTIPATVESPAPKRAPFSFERDIKEKLVAKLSPLRQDAPEITTSEEASPISAASISNPPSVKSPTQSDLLKELKGSLMTDVKRKPVSLPLSPPSPPAPSKSQQRAVSSETPAAEKEGVFARPTWAASARQSSAPSTAQKPSPPPSSAGATLSAPSYRPKPRTPSPGLLKRMASVESVKQANAEREKLIPQRLGLNKASVDDLRRLYEERAATAEKLTAASAASSRRGSQVSLL